MLGRNVKRFLEELVFKAHRLLYHSTPGSRVKKKKDHHQDAAHEEGGVTSGEVGHRLVDFWVTHIQDQDYEGERRRGM